MISIQQDLMSDKKKRGTTMDYSNCSKAGLQKRLIEWNDGICCPNARSSVLTTPLVPKLVQETTA